MVCWHMQHTAHTSHVWFSRHKKSTRIKSIRADKCVQCVFVSSWWGVCWRPATKQKEAWSVYGLGCGCRCNHYSLCALSMSQANICVYFTDLQAWKQLYELAEHWHRRAGKKKKKRQTDREGGREGEMREKETEIERERANERPIGTRH